MARSVCKRETSYAKNYEEHILEPVVKNLSETTFQGRQFLFQQDGAPAHISKQTQGWLRDNFPDFLTKEEWSPSSPDLNPNGLVCDLSWKGMHAQNLIQ